MKILAGLFIIALVGAAIFPLRSYGRGAYRPVPPGAIPVERWHVVDGDTIHVWIDGHRYKVRLLGIDTPETRRVGKMRWCKREKQWGKMATARVTELLDGAQSVHAELKRDGYGEVKRGRFGRALGQIYADGQDVGEVLLAEHLADRYEGRRKRLWCHWWYDDKWKLARKVWKGRH